MPIGRWAIWGVDRKTAIDRDVYHMARLGLNAYRIHIWDVEISDAEGNLLENEHGIIGLPYP